MPELTLPGCRSRPLGGYLKSLGLLRVVARQADSEARGCWRGGRFELATQLDREALEGFLLERYSPSPVVSPWNGGSGFFPKDRTEPIQAIESSRDLRLAPYREAISASRVVLNRRGLNEKPPASDKAGLVRELRRSLPDEALEWLDTAIVLTGRDIGYPPLLGSGGNDGRFDFSNNYAGAIAALITDRSQPAPQRSLELLHAALWDEPAPLHSKLSLAHFARDASPVNSPSGEADALGDPWELVLGLEGALVFCASAARRHGWELGARLVAPFTAQATAAGYPSALPAERGRAELWLPVWQAWATLSEVEALAREARAQVGRRLARTGLDFVRAAGELGVARGISAFERYSILERAGQSSLAVPAGRIEVASRPAARGIRSLDQWLPRVLGFARGDRCPRSVRSSVGALERALFDFADSGRPADACLTLERLGALEASLASTAAWALEAGLRPLARIPATPWLDAADDGSPEFALAVGFASLADDDSRAPDFRDYMHGTRVDEGGARSFDPEARNHIATGATAVARLAAIHARRQLDAGRDAAHENLRFPLGVSVPAAVLRRFAVGVLDDRRILRLAAGLCLLTFPEARLRRHPPCEDLPCPAFDTLLLAWHGTPEVPLRPRAGWAARLIAGRTRSVLEEAVLRLRLAEFDPLVSAEDLTAAAPPPPRLAAALLPAVSVAARMRTVRVVCPTTSAETETPKEEEIA